MEKDKKNHVVYTLRICFNPDTDEVDYIAEGIDDEFDFTPITPYNLDSNITSFFTSEDMETIRKLYDIEKN
mgnify:CR=1 FL=1